MEQSEVYLQVVRVNDITESAAHNHAFSTYFRL